MTYLQTEVSSSTSPTTSYSYPSAQFFWALSFAYASFAALLLQKAILPLWPEMHAGHGLLMNDAIVFHNIAVEIAQRIHTVGWSAWSMFPPGASGNVGLLAAIYAVLGPDPAWFIPFNAAAHATGALLIYQMGSRLMPGQTGKLGGLIAATVFLVFPSALQWYGQNHKDAFAIGGLLLLLDTWLGLHTNAQTTDREKAGLIIKALMGVVLVGLVRPYYVLVLALGLSASFVMTTLTDLVRHCLSGKRVAYQLLLIALVIVIGLMFSRIGTSSGVYGESGTDSAGFHWHSTKNIPLAVDKVLQRASELRAHFVAFGKSIGAGSDIDADQLPNTTTRALAYMPRALFVGLFAPFPNTWSERVTAPRLIGSIETACWYLFLLGAAITVVRRPERSLLAGAVFCASIIAVLAYVHPNVGTLYRQRFGLWHFFLLVGALGWASLILGYIQQRHAAINTLGTAATSPEQRLQPYTAASRVTELAASGAVVMLITLTCYLGFFVRDLLMIGHLGMGDALDAFLSAAMVAMFFVTCLAMPLGEAFLITFIASTHSDKRRQEQLLRHVLGFAALTLGTVCVCVALAAPYLAQWVLGSHASTEKLASTSTLLRGFTPLIALSAWTVVGNAALNSLGLQRHSALGQLFVPIITVIALLVTPATNAVLVAITGMLLGTAVNAVWVFVGLRSVGLALTPTRPCASILSPVISLYKPLLAAAFLPAALVALNYAFAALAGSGAISAWAFASKIVVLISGLTSVGATAVVLPHLAYTLTHGHQQGLREDANLLLSLGVWIGGLLMLGGFMFAEPLVVMTLSRNLSPTQITELVNIVKVGMLQLPLAISGALVTKMAVVSGHSLRVMYSAIFSFAGNVLVNLLLVPRLGVMGVAVGALVGIMLSTTLTLLASYRHIGLQIKEILIALMSWLIWVALCVAWASTSTAAIVSTTIGLFGMAWTQLNLLRTPLKPALNQDA